MEKEYIVTVFPDVDWLEVHNDIINDTSANDNVDSSIIPDRPIISVKERPNNLRNTHYSLTEEEADALRNDPRIMAVEAVDDIPEPVPTAFQEGRFDRTTTGAGQKDNWGLIRHTAPGNVYNNSTADPGLDYNYVLDGTGVDIVIMDTGIQVGHPEWEDSNGNSRLQLIDWFAESGVSGTQPANFYTDVNGHGTHCAGTMAGKRFGWAKNARIYSLTTYGNTGNSITFEDAVDCLIGWHNNKPIDPSTGVKRPTIVNMSFQYSWYIDTSVTPNQLKFTSTGTGYDITGGRYRGATHNETTRTLMQSKGVRGSGSTEYMFGRKYASKDADVQQLIANGIHVCTAAGNDYMKIDLPSGPDYNNYITINMSGITRYMYYHRGPSPSVFEGGDSYSGSLTQDSPAVSYNDGFDVGALDDSDLWTVVGYDGDYYNVKAGFSNSGPAVEIYAAGTSIISAVPDGQGNSYYYGPTGRQNKKSGTSMAAPQVCGIMACILQAHPDWTPKQVKQYILNNSQSLMYDTASTTDYISSVSLHGGNKSIAYLPMNGAKVFEHSI